MSAERGNEVFVVHEKLLSDAERDHFAAELNDETLAIGEILKNAQAVLEANENSLSNNAQLLVMMDEAIRSRSFKTVYLDYPSKEIPTWIAFSKQMYLQAFQLQMHGSPSDVVLDRLLILAIGVPLYLHAIDGPMFSYTALEGVPTAGSSPDNDGREVAIAATAPSARKPPIKTDANESFQILEEKLRHNHGSLSTAREMRRRLHRGEFKRLSNDEIQERVLSRFWRPAKPAVRAWLHAELNKKQAIEAPRRKREVSPERAHGVARTLLAQAGRSILFLHDENYARFKKHFIRLCD